MTTKNPRPLTDASISIMARLREETRDLHRHTESRVLQRQIARGEVSREAFAAYLGKLYLLHRVFESALDRARLLHPAVAAIAAPDRMRLAALADDLDYYGVEPANLELDSATGRFAQAIERMAAAQPVALLGVLYVLEGSTNGSRFLAQTLRTACGLNTHGLAYFDPYGDAQPERWASFREAMDLAELRSGEHDAIVEAARQTFKTVAEISDHVTGVARGS